MAIFGNIPTGTSLTGTSGIKNRDFRPIFSYLGNDVTVYAIYQTYSRYHRIIISERDGQTDRQSDGQNC